MKIFVFVFVAMVLPMTAAAQGPVKVPDEVKPFVESKWEAIALEGGDLNADGKKDFILVTSERVPESDPYEEGAGSRSVLILVRESDGSLKLAARNDLVAMCKACGGMFGDPFDGILVKGRASRCSTTAKRPSLGVPLHLRLLAPRPNLAGRPRRGTELP